MTDTETFFSDRRYLFLDNIYSTDQSKRENMTSFAVKRNTFRLFFADFESDNNPAREPNLQEEACQPPPEMDLDMAQPEQVLSIPQQFNDPDNDNNYQLTSAN